MKRLSVIVSVMLVSAVPSVSILAAPSTPPVVQQSGRVISGKVIDAQGEPIIGATVRVKGTNVVAVTDLDGRYTINAAKGTLVVSYIGSKTQEIAVGNRTTIDVKLADDNSELDEVVVTGYGVQKKASLTSAISQIKGDEAFANRGLASTVVSLQGEIPGLTVTRNSTRPGSEGSAMKIRGDISINGSSTPLIIIDGITGTIAELNAMNGNDIENISVLKDASAAIYGARAASGVVLVTTKRGRKGRAQITYNGSFSRTINGIQAPLTNNKEWLDMFYEAQYNDAQVVTGQTDPAEIEKNINYWIFNSFGGATLDATDIDPTTGAPTIYKGKKLFDALRAGQTLTLQNGARVERWEPNYYLIDQLYGQASSQKHNVSISGADDRFGYRASLAYESAASQLKPAYDGQRKWSGRVNADYQATPELKFETNMSYEKRNIQSPSTDVGAGWMDPWFWAVYNEQGDPYDTFSGNRNPVGGLKNGGTYRNQLTNFRGSIRAIYDMSRLLPGLTLSASGAYKRKDSNTTTERLKVQYYDWVGTPTGSKQSPGSLSEVVSKTENLNLGAFANYDHTFGGRHHVFGMIGVTAEDEKYKNISASRNAGPLFEGSGLTDLDVWVNSTNNGAGGGQSSWSLLSYLTRLSYTYSDTYSVEFLGRRDGSSKLSTAQRWKNFYSISGYWRISNERWLKHADWLSDLKLRYNYGKTGSVEGIGNYERFATVNTGSVLFGTGNPGKASTIFLSNMTSDLRTWETINSHDIGLDFAFLNSRLRGSFDYFVKTNDGMFISVEYPQVLGATAPKVNDGKFRAQGWEFAVDWNDRLGDLKYHVGFQVADAWNKVLRLTNNEAVPNPGINSSRLVGKPKNSIYVYKTNGLFRDQESVDAYYEKYYWNESHTGPKAGNILPAPASRNTGSLRPGARIIEDLDGDGVITNKDIYYAGDTSPRLTFGIKAGLEWKGFDLSVFFQGVGKQKLLRSGYFYAPWAVNYVMQNKTFMGKMWTNDNPDAEYAIASRNSGFNRFNYQDKDVSVQNNKYIRLKSLVVGYTLPATIVKKAGLTRARIYFSGDDLWEWTKVSDGYDPEYGEASNNTFPFSRLLTVGLDVTF